MADVLDLSGDTTGAYVYWEADFRSGQQGPYMIFTQYLSIGGHTTTIGEISPFASYGVYDIIGTQASDNLVNYLATGAGTVGGGGYIYGMGGDDIIGGASLLDGGAGNDRLIFYYAGTGLGGDGDDRLDGSTGADRMDGGAGIDTVRYDSAKVGVTVNLATGTASDGDQLQNIENVIGTNYADTLIGDAGANALTGGSGNDVLTGGAGADALDGSFGTDRAEYLGSAAGVTVNLATNANSGGDAAGDVLTGIENLGGSNFADSLTGDAGANTLWGRDGDDVLSGGGGNDALYGEAGTDMLRGGDGDDHLVGGAGADVLDGGIGTDTANYGNATAGVTLSLVTGGTGGDAAGDSFVSIEQVVGSAFDDLIQGDAGANALWGLDGADRLYGGLGGDILKGGAGDDALYGEDGSDRLEGGDGNDALIGGAGADLLIGGAGMDVANYASSAQGVTVNLAANSGSGGDAAGDTYSGVENVLGTAQADALTGDAGANALWGMGGNDILTGGAGADMLKGGAGADAFVYKSIADSSVAVSGRDSINDFSHAEGDRIDLHLIDADGSAGNGDTVFTFLGGGAFTGAGHELRVAVSGGVQVVQADLNGDKAADMAIVVVSATTLVAADFIL